MRKTIEEWLDGMEHAETPEKERLRNECAACGIHGRFGPKALIRLERAAATSFLLALCDAISPDENNDRKTARWRKSRGRRRLRKAMELDITIPYTRYVLLEDGQCRERSNFRVFGLHFPKHPCIRVVDNPEDGSMRVVATPARLTRGEIRETAALLRRMKANNGVIDDGDLRICKLMYTPEGKAEQERRSSEIVRKRRENASGSRKGRPRKRKTPPPCMRMAPGARATRARRLLRPAAPRRKEKADGQGRPETHHGGTRPTTPTRRRPWSRPKER